MLNEEQIGYLLQIKDTKPELPERTVRVMLSALRWSEDEIDKGIEFLKMPPAPENAVSEISTKPEEYLENEVLPFKPINIKQNPFPIGSPLIKKPGMQGEVMKKKINPIVSGVVVGLVVLLIILFLYSRLA